VQRRTHLTIVIIIAALVCISALTNFFGCASSGSATKPFDPARQKAIQDSLFNIHKTWITIRYSLGYEPYKQHDYAKAKRYFRLVAENDTTGIYANRIYNQLGTCYLQLGEPDSAEWAYKLGISNVPDRPYPYKALGYIYRQQNRNGEAIDIYEKLTTLEPDSAVHYRSLGQLYVQTDQQDKAIQAYQKVIEIEPNDKRSQEVLDNLIAQTGDIDAVIAQRETMVERFPDDMKLRLDLGQSYHRIGEFEKAIPHLKLVLDNESDNLLANELIGDCYQQTDQFSAAIEIYQGILEKDPEDKKNMCNLALSLTSLGRYTAAMQQVRKSLRIDSNYGLAYLTRGIIYETTADKCVRQAGGNVTFDDKLVYKMAYDEYQRAARDLEWKPDAERRLDGIKTLIPTREDYFMHNNQKLPRSACYEWIQ